MGNHRNAIDPLRLNTASIHAQTCQITLGIMQPVRCVAVARERRSSVAMPRRRNGEPLSQLLIRLDQAIAKALYEDVFTDEINVSR